MLPPQVVGVRAFSTRVGSAVLQAVAWLVDEQHITCHVQWSSDERAAVVLFVALQRSFFQAGPEDVASPTVRSARATSPAGCVPERCTSCCQDAAACANTYNKYLPAFCRSAGTCPLSSNTGLVASWSGS